MVQVLPLDSLFSDAPVQFIKIDVEGAEADVIRGAQQIIAKNSPILYVENDRVAKSQELLELLFSLDYKCYWHLARFYSEDNFNRHPDKIHVEAFLKTPESSPESPEYTVSGYAINMLCIPKSLNITINLPECINSLEHPCLLQFMSTIAPGIKILEH